MNFVPGINLKDLFKGPPTAGGEACLKQGHSGYYIPKYNFINPALYKSPGFSFIFTQTVTQQGKLSAMSQKRKRPVSTNNYTDRSVIWAEDAEKQPLTSKTATPASSAGLAISLYALLFGEHLTPAVPLLLNHNLCNNKYWTFETNVYMYHVNGVARSKPNFCSSSQL